MHRLPNTRTPSFLEKPFPSPNSAYHSVPTQGSGAAGDLSQDSEKQPRDVGERPDWQISFPKDLPGPTASSPTGSWSRFAFPSASQAQPALN